MNRPLLLPALLLLYGAAAAQAQPCEQTLSSINLETANVRARINGGGHLFTTGSEGQFNPYPTEFELDDPSTIYGAGLWLGGVDAAGNLKLAVAEYFTPPAEGSDFWPGPLDPATGTTNAGACALWDRHFAVYGQQVADFLAALPGLSPAEALDEYTGVMAWPATGNPYFDDIWGFALPGGGQPLAPFHDADGNGLYDPMQGDYPVVRVENKPEFVPHQFVWVVFNDHGGGQAHPVSEGSAFKMEVQLQAWAFDCPDQPAVNRTVFTAHKMINRAVEPIDSMYFGLWVDFDIGCHFDDYVGSLPGQNSFFAYNADGVDDAACLGVPTFAGSAPAQSVTFLNRSLDHFVYMRSATPGGPPTGPGSAEEPWQYYSVLTGRFSDGTPVTASGSGYQTAGPVTDHAFPGDPADLSAWSACSGNLIAGDLAGVGSHRLGRLEPGHVEELVTAWTYHPDTDLPCDVGSTSADIAAVQARFDAGFAGVCSPLSATPEVVRDALALQPNPAGDAVTVRYGAYNVRELRLFNAEGRLVRIQGDLPAGETRLVLGELPAGMYTVALLAETQVLTARLFVR
jgi:hypothetical protein